MVNTAQSKNKRFTSYKLNKRLLDILIKEIHKIHIYEVNIPKYNVRNKERPLMDISFNNKFKIRTTDINASPLSISIIFDDSVYTFCYHLFREEFNELLEYLTPYIKQDNKYKLIEKRYGDITFKI